MEILDESIVQLRQLLRERRRREAGAVRDVEGLENGYVDLAMALAGKAPGVLGAVRDLSPGRAADAVLDVLGNVVPGAGALSARRGKGLPEPSPTRLPPALIGSVGAGLIGLGTLFEAYTGKKKAQAAAPAAPPAHEAPAPRTPLPTPEAPATQAAPRADLPPHADTWGVSPEGLEPVTVKWLHGAYLARPALQETEDFAAVVVLLGKAFECELNLSLAQWARQRLGVTLPRYFGAHQPGVKARLLPDVPEPREIDLNAARDGEWLPPGMGQSLLVLKALTKEGPPPPWTPEQWPQLVEAWQRLTRLRNHATHTGEVDATALGEAVGVYADLVGTQAFAGMVTLKGWLRG